MSAVLKQEIIIDFRLTIAEAEHLLKRLQALKCGDPTELYRTDVGKINNKLVYLAVGLKQ